MSLPPPPIVPLSTHTTPLWMLSHLCIQYRVIPAFLRVCVVVLQHQFFENHLQTSTTTQRYMYQSVGIDADSGALQKRRNQKQLLLVSRHVLSEALTLLVACWQREVHSCCVPVGETKNNLVMQWARLGGEHKHA